MRNNMSIINEESIEDLSYSERNNAAQNNYMNEFELTQIKNYIKQDLNSENYLSQIN